MSIESLQRAAEAAGFATASDDNPVLTSRLSQVSDPLHVYRAHGPLASALSGSAAGAVTVGPAAVLWGRASLGHLIPTWANRG